MCKVNVAAPDVGILPCLESGTRWKHTCSRSLTMWLHCTEKMDKQQGTSFCTFGMLYSLQSDGPCTDEHI